jgi:catechol 2,3-dioxygenase-like lactoylglutathione lyase family enzyme
MSRVTGIRYVGYGIADFDAERAFYHDIWGLVSVAESENMAWFATEGHGEHHVVRLRRAETKRVDVIALAANTVADVDALREKVLAVGCKGVTEAATITAPGGGYGFRFFSPDGLTFEISSDVAAGPSRDLMRWEGIPEKISHIVLHSPDHPAAVKFFCDVLGFKVSDWLGDFMCFLRCDAAHHRLAFLPGPACLNHVAYDMPSVDDMMRGIHRLKLKQIDIRWGPGRHTAGNNTFSYFTTPSEFAVEYTSELEDVDDATWVAQVMVPAPLVMDQWGIGVGGPQTMPHPAPDAGLFQAAAV